MQAVSNGNKRFSNNTSARQFRSSVNNNRRNDPPQRQRETPQHVEDFEGFLNDDDDFLAELDDDINFAELNGSVNPASLNENLSHPSTSTQQPSKAQIVVIDDGDEDEHRNFNVVEDNFLKDASDDEVIRSFNEKSVNWQFDDDDDFEWFVSVKNMYRGQWNFHEQL